MSPSKISVVLPVKDRAEIVLSTLDSIYRQTCRPLSLVIVDNASTDSTLKVVNEWADRYRSEDFLVTVTTERTPGASAARNAGLALVQSPYVMFFDSDDIMLPRHVDRVSRAIDLHPEAKILYWDVAIIDSDGWMTIKRPTRQPLLTSHLLHGILSTQRMAVATDHIRSVGGWDQALRQWDDLELGLRLLIKNSEYPVKTYYITSASPQVRIYPRADSLTGPDYTTVADNLLHALAAISIDIDQAPVPPEEHRHLQALLDLRRADLAGHLAHEGRTDLAAPIMKEILASAADIRTALILRQAYLTVRCFGRGAYILAPLLAPKKIK